MREQSYTCIVLKKQPVGDADEIITFFSLELGKIRAMAKSVKLSKSRLQNYLQALFLVNLRTAGGKGASLPKIIGAEPVEIFSELRKDLHNLTFAFSAMEMVLRFMPDEQKNEGVYFLLAEFLRALNSGLTKQGEVLLSFKLKFLKNIGLSIKLPKPEGAGVYMFDLFSGGFSQNPKGLIKSFEIEILNYCLSTPLGSVAVENNEAVEKLSEFVDRFLEFQLERELKAEKSLRGVI